MDGNRAIPNPSDRLLTLVHQASAAARQLRRRLDELAATIDLSDGELLVVWLCGSQRGQVQGDLATAIGVSPAQMSGIVERLRQRGLIAMERSPLDRRRQVWHGTAASREIFARLERHLFDLASQLDGHVSAADRDAALSLCQRLAAAAEQVSVDATNLRVQEAA